MFPFTPIETHRASGCLLVSTPAAAAAAAAKPSGVCVCGDRHPCPGHLLPDTPPQSPAPSAPFLTSHFLPCWSRTPRGGGSSPAGRLAAAPPCSRPAPSAACCTALPATLPRALHSLRLHGGGLIFSFHQFHGDLICAIALEVASGPPRGASWDPPLPQRPPQQSHTCSVAGAPVTPAARHGR